MRPARIGATRTARALAALWLILAAAPASGEEASSAPTPRTLLFGDLHVHSSWSFDAYSAQVVAPPRDAYRYARGETIAHHGDRPIALTGPPLDFMALTDHAEYLGVTQAAADPEHALRKQPLIRTWTTGPPQHRRLAWNRIYESYRRRQGLPALTQPAVLEPAWGTLVALANAQYVPGEFTTFAAFEYTSNPEGRNLHRNVLFRGSAPSRPFSSMDSANPEDLWRWLDEVREGGHDALAIPHNANGSDGRMFATTRFDGGPLDADWIALRARNEPAMEVFQIKGASETHPTLSPDDPFAHFEIIARRTTAPGRASAPPGSYLRDALRRGLSVAKNLGENPFRLGVVASTDGHNAASPFEEENYTGKIGNNDSTIALRLAPGPPGPPRAEPVASLVTRWGAAGLAGVWAESNRREAIFDAIRRRETYGTSGTRIRVRLAAGWSAPDDGADDPGAWIEAGSGTPMGSVLPPAPHTAARPTFVVAAQRDPRSAPLDRVQIVRGWIDTEGETHERVFDLACAAEDCAARAPDPDLETCQWDESAGRPEIRVRWQDPMPVSPGGTFYYVRVLEIPTCRWSTWDANRAGRARPEGVPAAIQERAVTSPVWTR
ncbi:MAG: DUF3604 domain-containing protein [bacterium]|nr:DUF3604 domain-containing protein [bacterium]